MRLVLVEDDYLQAEWLCEALESRFQGISIDVLETELEFLQSLTRFEASPPSIFVVDVMLRWTNPSPQMQPAPETVRENGAFRAGLRIETLIRKSSSLAHIPVLFYTVLQEQDFGSELNSQPASNTLLLSKEPEPEALFDAIQAFVSVASK